MSLKESEKDLNRCIRCSYCKWVPELKIENLNFVSVCPSISRYNFHGYSGGGKVIAALALLKGRIDYSDEFLDMIYRCHVCGACDVSCKVNMDTIEPLQRLHELRAKCVEDGQLLPAHMLVIESLKKEDNTMLAKKADRGNWAEGLDVKDLNDEKAEVLFHAGCRYSFDEELWPAVRSTVGLLQKAGIDLGIMGKEEKVSAVRSPQKAGIDLGIMGKEETCCGGRAYEMGYQGELTKYAEHNVERWKATGVKTVITACADCYHTFKILYNKIGQKPEVEIIHITEYLGRLIKKGKLRPAKAIPMTVTYHDPCHLGRLADPWISWEGEEKKVLGQLIVHDPPREIRRGAKGVYDLPRDIIRSIPGVRFNEMYRIREYGWCCGAAGGVKQAFPDFALWTGEERIKEAEDVGAEAIITACPWCKRNFKDVLENTDHKMEVYDIVELLEKTI